MPIPFLKNFRRGFATNSSSSHSFVYLKKDGELGAENPGDYTDGEFHWNDFRLDTIREKLFYVLVGRIGGGWGDDDGSQAFADYGDRFPELSEDDFRAAASGSIDHDSLGLISEEAARDPRTVIFGGNDNESPGSAERVAAIRAGEIDWTRTEMGYEDLEHIQITDEEGQKAAKIYLGENPWAAR